MLAVSATLKAAIESQAQTLACQVLLDADRNGLTGADDISKYVEDLTITRALTTDTPDGTRMVSGENASSLDATLGGDPANNAHHAAWTWSPYQAASPFYGKRRMGAPVQLKAGQLTSAGPELLPRFSGFVRRLDVHGADAGATLTAEDGSDNLHTPVAVPMVANGYIPPATQPGVVQIMGIRPGLDGQWPQDYILRRNGVYASPPPRPGCVLSATMHGSAAPDVGRLSYAFTGVLSDGIGNYAIDGPKLVYAQGNFAEALTPQPPLSSGGAVIGYLTAADVPMRVGSVVVLEGWVNTTVPAGLPAGAPLWTVQLASLYGTTGGPPPNTMNSVVLGMDSARRPFVKPDALSAPVTTTAPGGTGWVYVQAIVTIAAASVSCVWRLNGSQRAPVTAPITGSSFAYPALTSGAWQYTTALLSGLFPAAGSSADYGCMVPVEALQVSVEAAPVSNFGFLPTAVLEPSLNLLTVIPYTEAATDAWGLIQQIVSAEFGTALFDEAGIYRFWNRYHFTGQRVDFIGNTVTAGGITAPIPTISSVRALQTVSTSEAEDSVRNIVTATATPHVIAPASWVWTEGGTIGLHSGQTRKIWAEFANPVVGLSLTAVVVPRGGDTAGASGYRACSTPDGKSGGFPVENLQITITPFATRALLTITNPNRYPVYLVTPPQNSGGVAYPDASIGQPLLELWGRNILTVAAAGDSGAPSSGSTASTQVSDQASIDDAYREQSYDMPATDWLQDNDVAAALATDLLAMLGRPNPLLTDVAIVADPRLQLGDRIVLQDPSSMGIDVPAWIVGITENLTASDGWSQALTLRCVAGVDGWILGSPTRSVLGRTTILGGVY